MQDSRLVSNHSLTDRAGLMVRWSDLRCIGIVLIKERWSSFASAEGFVVRAGGRAGIVPFLNKKS